MKNEYENWSKEDLLNEIRKLKKRKRYGLVWENKPEDVVELCKNQLPILKEIGSKSIESSKEFPNNILIEGDNFHALSVLNYTHKGKIDLIYIDPPYNTGARDWKYNNDYVDENDAYRHSKWLSFMNNRLKIAKGLLAPKGVLICTIDKNEQERLGLLLEEVFSGYEITTVVIEHNPKGLPSKNFSYSHEYALFVIPKGVSAMSKNPRTKVDTRNLRRAGKASYREERPTMFYPIYVKDNEIIRIGEQPKDTFHPERRSIEKKNGEIEIWPIDDKGRERRWHFGLDSVNEHLDRIEIKEKDGDYQLYVTAVPARYKTVWTGGDLDAGKYGTTLVKNIVGEEFPYPKSIHATTMCLEAIILKNPKAVVLDFFAGSGTTGHAVLSINKLYGGNRKFILCTNNEVNDKRKSLENEGLSEDEIQEHGICRAITYPRIKKVIEGYTTDNDNVKGLGGNLRYYKTDFIDSTKTDANKALLTQKAVDMLCIKEEAFDSVSETKNIKIFENHEKFLAVLLNTEDISELKREIKKLNKPVNVYIFSLSNDLYEDEFTEFGEKVTLSPIPEAIYKVYKRIFK